MYTRKITMPLAATTMCLLAACASNGERPTEQLTLAEASIREAEQSGARAHSALELDQARQKLNQAQDAADDGENGAARRLAEQAAADAELAAARARAAESEQAAQALRDTIATLQREAVTE